MTLDVDVYLEGETVHIEAGNWGVQRQSSTVGEIFCEKEYVFVEDLQLGLYQVFAPEAVDDTVLQSEGETVDDARANIDETIETYRANFGVVNYGISGTLAFDRPDK